MTRNCRHLAAMVHGGTRVTAATMKQVGNTVPIFVNKEGRVTVLEAEAMNLRRCMYVAKHWYHARGACFKL